MANYDDLAQALASKGAAFGVFPQMGGRRRFQDPQASADVPFQALRGSFAGLLGMLPDVANFMGRSPMPTEALGEFDYGPRQQLPYGLEFYLKELPLAPTSPVGQLAGQIGSFVPLSPMPAVRAGKGIARMAGQEITDVMSGFPPRSLLGQLTPKPLMIVESSNRTFKAPQETALALAQQRAALPVEQGGLGLPVGNTAEMRAAAMNAEDVYHGTNAEKQILNDLNFNLDADQRSVGGIWTTKDKNYASWLADQKDKNAAGVMSLKLLNAKNSNEYDILQEGIKLADEIGVPIPKNALEAQELLAGGYGWDRVISDLLSQSKTPNLKITNFNDAYHSNPNEVTTAFITKDPSLLRLPNAAFDPFRRNAAIATSMGVALPDLLAAEKENKQKKLSKALTK